MMRWPFYLADMLVYGIATYLAARAYITKLGTVSARAAALFLPWLVYSLLLATLLLGRTVMGWVTVGQCCADMPVNPVLAYMSAAVILLGGILFVVRFGWRFP